jgi:hypothetical protein
VGLVGGGATCACISQTESGSDPWPAETTVDIADVDVGISRTDPLISCREVEQLHLDLIAAAREFLYIENQYLTSTLIVHALNCRLQEIDGPEIVMVLPLNNHGWLDQNKVGCRRRGGGRLPCCAYGFTQSQLHTPLPKIGPTASGSYTEMHLPGPSGPLQ